MNNIKQQIRGFIKRFIGEYDLKDDEDIFSIGMISSLFAMQLIMFIEQEFSLQVDINDMEISNFNTVNAISKYVERMKRK